MKWLKVFALFAVLHAAGWAGTHVWLRLHPKTVLIVADTSFAMKPEFPAMRRWIDAFAADARYVHIVVGTDKALIGPLDELRSTDALFRTSFGRSTSDSLKRYASVDADERIVLSDGSLDAGGWRAVEFGAGD